MESIYEKPELPKCITGSYDLISCIKCSEKSSLYKVSDKKSGDIFLLKEKSVMEKERVEGEYRMLKKIHDDNPGIHIPKAVDFIQDKDACYLVREYIRGKTLSDMVEDSEELSDIETGLDIADEVCDILMQLHSMNPQVIVRDIKASNIVMSGDSQNYMPYLIDLDASRFYNRDTGDDTIYLGTKQTAAPEQFGFSQTDVRTDVYGAGMLLLFLLTGDYDKNGANFKRLPFSIRHVINKATSFDPKRRYKSIRSFRIAL